MASATPASTNGKRSSAGWMSRSQAAEVAGGREHAAEAVAGRRHAGQCGVEGPFGKEMVTPAAERKAVAHLRAAFEMSERRACKAIGCCRLGMRYKTTRG